MRVAFDSRPAADPRGVGRYSRCLLEALRDTADGEGEIVETHRPGAPADVFHAPWMEGAMLRSPCPMVVTLHDLAALKRRSEHLRTGVRLRLRQLAVQRAERVIVPTEAVADDAVERFGLERERVVVIPEAPDAMMYPRPPTEIAEARGRFGLPERYLVWVGGLQHPDPRKHVAKLAATPRELPLVLVGPTRPWAHELPDVTLTGHVSDEHLAAIYSGAHALVLPSEDEGFGLPAVEALACGTPVVACEVPALREVLDERATFVEVGDLKALIDAAETLQPPGAGATRVDLAGRRARDLAGLRGRGRAQSWAAQRHRTCGDPSGRGQPDRAGLTSVGAALHEHRGDRLQQDRQVERQRPALQVDEVEVHEVVEVELRAARDLPQAGDPGEHQIALAVPVLEHLVVALGQRTRADERHLAAQHVHQLRQLVQREAPQHPPDARQARVVADLEQRARGLVELFEVGLALLGVGVHRAELQARERSLADAAARRAEHDRPARGERARRARSPAAAG